MCYAPPQAVPGVVQVTASNDGASFSAPARSSARGVGTFLTYTVVAGRPWGAWALAPAAATFAPPGGARLEVALRGAPLDGGLQGGPFLATGPGLARCAFSTSLRTAFDAFGPVTYAPPDGAAGVEAEEALGLPPQAGPAWEERHQAGDVTYQLRAVTAATFVWRAFPAGFPPSGAAPLALFARALASAFAKGTHAASPSFSAQRMRMPAGPRRRRPAMARRSLTRAWW